MKKIILVYVVSLIFFSCNNRNLKNENLTGQWAISKIEYADMDYEPFLYSNALIFKEDNIVSIPETEHFNKEYGHWEVINSNKQLKITCVNKVFRGVYNISYKSHEKNTEILLESDSTHIKMTKLLSLLNLW